ncbi:MAG: GDP-mannose 4,6-dehydratase [Actinobacteria bacterium]|nr:GDP-mannose 4,6-dehydratase [Actinomycetota bacterium]
MSRTRALITGIGGQDGSYLAELLVRDGAEVLGVERPGGSAAYPNLVAVQNSVVLVEADLCDAASVVEIVEAHRPNMIFHLAASSFVPDSWLHPTPTVEMAATSTSAFLDAIVNIDRSIRFFQAASAEVFGRPTESPQSEATPIAPITPYGAGKALSLFMTRIYRERFDLHASTGILFNHESPRRPVSFVTRKITHAAVKISQGRQTELRLGNLDAERDWTFAGDTVRGMALMLEGDRPGDYVLASGHTHSIREVLDIAFGRVGLDWSDYVVVDEQFNRPNEAVSICGDPSKAERELGWHRDVSFQQLIEMMVDADLAASGA